MTHVTRQYLSISYEDRRTQEQHCHVFDERITPLMLSVEWPWNDQPKLLHSSCIKKNCPTTLQLKIEQISLLREFIDVNITCSRGYFLQLFSIKSVVVQSRHNIQHLMLEICLWEAAELVQQAKKIFGKIAVKIRDGSFKIGAVDHLINVLREYLELRIR